MHVFFSSFPKANINKLDITMKTSSDFTVLKLPLHRLKESRWTRVLSFCRTYYFRYCVDLTNFAEYWLFPYEDADFRRQLEEVWNEIRPLYEQLHAYVRRKLRDFYGPEKISRQAPLPAHVLGMTLTLKKSHCQLDLHIFFP